MSTVFLTSNPISSDRQTLNEENNLIERLQKTLPKVIHAVFVCSDPEDHEGMGYFANEVRNCFERSGFSFASFVLLDGQNELQAEEVIKQASFILLLGGHVPTQQKFFSKIHLKELLHDTNAVLMGFSAGSMNLADIVYAMPELPGEAVSQKYQRFLPGLGFTKTMVIPHYQYIKTVTLDGQRMIEDIAFEDSMGREFIAIPDGSYIEIENGEETVYGEAYCIREGKIERIS